MKHFLIGVTVLLLQLCAIAQEVNPGYSIGFDTATLDSKWTIHTTTSNSNVHVKVSDHYDRDNNGKTIKISCPYYTQKAFLISPKLNGLSTTSSISMWLKKEDSSNIYMQIGFMTDPNNPDTFTRMGYYATKSVMTLTNIDMANYKPSYGQYLAFRASGGPRVYIDDFSYDTCLAPSNINISNLKENSFTASWGNPNNATGWEIQYTVNDDIYNPIKIQTSQPNYTFTNLLGQHKYSFKVKAICQTNELHSGYSDIIDITTPCDVISTPYFQTFENKKDLYPCWSSLIINNGNNSTVNTSFTTTRKWSIHGNSLDYSVTPITGERFLAFDNVQTNNAGNQAILISPRINNLDTNKRIRFNFIAWNDQSNYFTSNLVIGTISDPSNASTFHPLTTITPSDMSILDTSTGIRAEWKEHTVYFNGYNGTDKYIAIKLDNTKKGDDYAFEDFRYEMIPNCTAPLYPKATNITYNSAKISWLNPPYSTGSSWQLEYGTKGFTQGNGTLINISANDFTLNNLPHDDAEYDFYIRSNCGSQKSTWVKGTFKTPCFGITAPHTQNFDTFPIGKLSNCWTKIYPFSGNHFSDFTSYIRIVNGNPQIYQTPFSPPNSVFIGGYRSNPLGTEASKRIILVTPRLADFNNNKKIKFMMTPWVHRPNKLIVGVLTDPNDYTTFQAYKTITIQDHQAANPIEVDLSAYEGNGKYVGFRIEGSDSGSVMIDNFEYLPVHCNTPTQLINTEITETTALIVWKDHNTINPAESWEIEYGPKGYTASQATTITANNTQHLLTGLTPKTEYEFRVRAHCGSTHGYGEWSKKQYFKTTCTITAPYHENFDSYYVNDQTVNLNNQCWTFNKIRYASKLRINNFEDKFSTVIISGATTENESNYILASPYLSDLDQNKIIKFKGRKYEPYPFNLIIGTMTVPNDPSTFTPYKTLSHEVFDQDGLNEILVDFSNYTGSDKYIAFKAKNLNNLTYNNNTYYIAQFDYLDKTTNCISPHNIKNVNVFEFGAKIKWETYTPGNFQIQYGPANFSLGTGTVKNTGDTHYEFTGLSPFTWYEYYLRKDCGSNNYSKWEGPYQFKTLHNVTETLPWFESFENLPQLGWHKLPAGFAGHTNDKWIATNSQYLDGLHPLHPHHPSHGNNYIYMDSDYPSWLLTPTFQLEQGKKYMFLYDYASNAIMKEIKVYYGHGKNVSDMNHYVGPTEIPGGSYGDPPDYHFTSSFHITPTATKPHTFGLFFKDNTPQAVSDNPIAGQKVSVDRFQLIDNLPNTITTNYFINMQGPALDYIGFEEGPKSYLSVANLHTDYRGFRIVSKREPENWANGEPKDLFDLNADFKSEIIFSIDLTSSNTVQPSFRFKYFERPESYLRILVNDLPVGEVIASPNGNYQHYVDLSPFKGELITLKIQGLNKNHEDVPDNTYLTYINGFRVTVKNEFSIGEPENLTKCDRNNDTFETFNLTLNNSHLLNGLNASTYNVTYFKSAHDAFNNANQIANPNAYQNTTNSETIYARVASGTNYYNAAYKAFKLIVQSTPKIVGLPELLLCDVDRDGVASFNLRRHEELLSNINSNVTFSYFPSEIDAVNNTNIIQTPNAYFSPIGTTNIFIKITNINACYTITSFKITANQVPLPGTVATYKKCDENHNGSTTFDLTTKINELKQNDEGATVRFFLSQEDATALHNELSTVDSFVNTTNPQTIYARITNSTSGCFSVTSFDIEATSDECEELFTIHPNPVHQYLYLNTTSKINTQGYLIVFDLAGKEVLQEELTLPFGTKKIDVSLLEPGIYFISVLSNHHSFTEKFMKL